MQHNFSDPESLILKGPDGVLQGYNARIAVLPMLRKVKKQSGQKPTVTSLAQSEV